MKIGLHTLKKVDLAGIVWRGQAGDVSIRVKFQGRNQVKMHLHRNRCASAFFVEFHYKDNKETDWKDKFAVAIDQYIDEADPQKTQRERSARRKEKRMRKRNLDGA